MKPTQQCYTHFSPYQSFYMGILWRKASYPITPSLSHPLPGEYLSTIVKNKNKKHYPMLAASIVPVIGYTDPHAILVCDVHTVDTFFYIYIFTCTNYTSIWMYTATFPGHRVVSHTHTENERKGKNSTVFTPQISIICMSEVGEGRDTEF